MTRTALPDRAGEARRLRGAALGALAGLAVLKAVMLAALFTRTPPFPPPFLAPLIGATLALAALAAALVLAGSRAFLAPALPFAALSLLSYGPHKLWPGENPFFFAQDPATWPAILVGGPLIAVLAWSSLRLAGLLRGAEGA